MRRFRSILIAAVFVLTMGLLAWHLAPRATAQSAQARIGARAVASTTTATIKPAEPTLNKSVPPGSLLYTAKRGDSIASVAHHFITADFLSHFG